MNRTVILSLALCAMQITSEAADKIRSPKHEAYAQKLWEAIHGAADYKQWQRAEDPVDIHCGPSVLGLKLHLNREAAADASLPARSVVVGEHVQADTMTGVTVWYRMQKDYDPTHDDWYFAHFTPEGEVVQTSVDHEPYAKPGFVTFVRDGRLWVFRPGSQDLAEFVKSGEPAKQVVRPGSGPDGMTIKAPDADLILEYLTAKPGFVTAVRDGRLWVFRPDSADLAEFRATGEPAQHVIRPGSGPGGITIKAPDVAIIDEYLR